MKTAIIIHGTGGSPEENWFPWMKEQLETDWYKVYVPRFPTPHNQDVDTWMGVIDEYRKYLDEDTIFIGHSVWPAFILSVLETLDTPVKACYFASWFLELIQIPEFDIVNETITAKQFDWEKIHSKCQKFYMVYGSDDPYVPMHNVEILAENLWIEVDIIEWWGHLNGETGYTEFEYLKNIILQSN